MTTLNRKRCINIPSGTSYTDAITQCTANIPADLKNKGAIIKGNNNNDINDIWMEWNDTNDCNTYVYTGNKILGDCDITNNTRIVKKECSELNGVTDPTELVGLCETNKPTGSTVKYDNVAGKVYASWSESGCAYEDNGFTFSISPGECSKTAVGFLKNKNECINYRGLTNTNVIQSLCENNPAKPGQISGFESSNNVVYGTWDTLDTTTCNTVPYWVTNSEWVKNGYGSSNDSPPYYSIYEREFDLNGYTLAAAGNWLINNDKLTSGQTLQIDSINYTINYVKYNANVKNGKMSVYVEDGVWIEAGNVEDANATCVTNGYTGTDYNIGNWYRCTKTPIPSWKSGSEWTKSFICNANGTRTYTREVDTKNYLLPEAASKYMMNQIPLNIPFSIDNVIIGNITGMSIDKQYVNIDINDETCNPDWSDKVWIDQGCKDYQSHLFKISVKTPPHLTDIAAAEWMINDKFPLLDNAGNPAKLEVGKPFKLNTGYALKVGDTAAVSANGFERGEILRIEKHSIPDPVLFGSQSTQSWIYVYVKSGNCFNFPDTTQKDTCSTTDFNTKIYSKKCINWNKDWNMTNNETQILNECTQNIPEGSTELEVINNEVWAKWFVDDNTCSPTWDGDWADDGCHTDGTKKYSRKVNPNGFNTDAALTHMKAQLPSIGNPLTEGNQSAGIIKSIEQDIASTSIVVYVENADCEPSWVGEWIKPQNNYCLVNGNIKLEREIDPKSMTMQNSYNWITKNNLKDNSGNSITIDNDLTKDGYKSIKLNEVTNKAILEQKITPNDCFTYENATSDICDVDTNKLIFSKKCINWPSDNIKDSVTQCEFKKPNNSTLYTSGNSIYAKWDSGVACNATVFSYGDVIKQCIVNGSWKVNTSYIIGNKVTYNGSNYSCIQAHTSTTSITPLNTTYWVISDIVFGQDSGMMTPTTPGVPAWTIDTAYKIGNIVIYNSQVYICISLHTSTTTWNPTAVPTLWIMIKSWVDRGDAVLYKAGNIVIHNGVIYSASIDIKGKYQPGISYWANNVIYWIPVKNWEARETTTIIQAYKTNDLTIHNGTIYQAKTNVGNFTSFVPPNITYWKQPSNLNLNWT